MNRGRGALQFLAVSSAVALVLGCSGSTTSSLSDGTGGSADGTGGAAAEPRTPLDAGPFCDRLVNECGSTSLTYERCVSLYTTMRVTEACKNAIDASTCETLMADGSTSVNVCFPSCEAAESTCNEDGTLTRCSDTGGALHLFVLDCDDVCATTDEALTWTGVCGTSWGLQTTTDNKCWCE